MRSFQLITALAITTVIVLTQQNILESCVENDYTSQQLQLKQFLSTCLKNEAVVEQIINKLDKEGIDYDTLFQLAADDIRATFKEFGIKSWHTGLIINKLHDIEGSGVQKYPSEASQSIVVLSTKQNEYILALNRNTENVFENIAKLKQAQTDINNTAKNIAAQIDQYYTQLINILNEQRTRRLQKLDIIKNRKLKLLNDQIMNATKTLNYLQNSSNNLTDIMNDMILDVAKKQYSITQLIESSQQSLLNYQQYLQQNIQLITEPKIKYHSKDKRLFEEFMMNIDDILDTDIDFSKIQFDDIQITLQWMSELNRLQNNITFDLQFKLYNNNKWNVLATLEPNQTIIILNENQIKLFAEMTSYSFRIQQIFSANRIYSQVLTTKTNTLHPLHSNIISYEEKKILVKLFPKGMDQKFRLLFRGSRDGFASSVFHSKCDNKGSTLVIVQSEHNHVFGGYTTKSWNGNIKSYVRDDQAWIYLLRSAKKDSPQKWTPTKHPENAIYCHAAYGPTFGGGHDLYLSNGCNSNTNSHSDLGHSYSSPSDKNKLAGSYQFKVIDYEVWQVID